MSKKSREAKQQQVVSERIALRRRRWLLGLHILFQACVVIGSQGAWYTAVHKDKELFTVEGPDYALNEDRPQPGATDGIEGARVVNAPAQVEAPSEPGFFSEPGRLAALAMFAALGAFFFASFDLVADANIQLPILICSLLVCLAAWFAFDGIYLSQATLGEIIEEVERARGFDSAVGGAAAVDSGVAAVSSAERVSLAARLPRLRLEWGSALIFAAAPLMTLLSIYLTFFAARTTPERS